MMPLRRRYEAAASPGDPIEPAPIVVSQELGANMKVVAIRTILYLISLLGVCCNAAAAPLDYLPALAGDYFVVESNETGRPYHIYIRLPEDYGSSDTDYPTVYVLDGDILFPMIAAYHLLLHYDEPAPDAIIVGIAYGTFDRDGGNYRDTDYTAPPLDDGDPEGGAAAYQRFLETELIPLVESRFRSDPDKRILVGQSRGGQFVLYSAFSKPDLFWARIASNPALTPNPSFFFGTPAPSSRDDLHLYYASGARDIPQLRAQALEWFAEWARREDAPWRLRTQTFEGETHAAGILNVYRAGLLWVFEDERRD